MSNATTIIRSSGEGELRRFFGGGLLRMKLTDEETGGALMLFEDELTGGKNTSSARARAEDELLFVLEGENSCPCRRRGRSGWASRSRFRPARGRTRLSRYLAERARLDASDARDG